MLLPELIYILLWAFSLSLLAVLLFLSLFIFSRAKRKLFGYYALYCLLVWIYLSSKLTGTPFYNLFSQQEFQDLNWLIQIYFYCCYYLFGIHFLNINQSFPKFYTVIKKYVITVITLSTAITLYGIFAQHHLLNIIYALGFIPLHIVAAIVIMYFALKVPNRNTRYFIVGSIIYIVLAVFAFIGNDIDALQPFGIDSLVWFFLAVILEISIFSYALGLMIWHIYKEEKETAIELSQTLLLLEQKMEKEALLYEKEKALVAAQEQELNLKNKLSLLQNKILFEQINFHFIFNVLNAIKLFILENENKKAVNYLSKFSKFIRNSLDSSRSSVVSLKDELNNMHTFLEIEEMRFENKFEYYFEVDDRINLSDVMIPSFLLQPLLENALWHGIMKLNKKGVVAIRVKQERQDIIIQIEDNGIGIQKSLTQKNSDHKSLGTSLVHEIIEHFNIIHKKNMYLEIDDKSYMGQESGTLVTIQFIKALDNGNDSLNH